MPSRNPPTSTRCGKGFTKAETTTLLKTIEHVLPIGAEGWNEVHNVFNSKHTPRGVEGLKCKFNKLAKKQVPTGNPNMPQDVKLAKAIKSKLFCHSRVTNLSEDEDDDEEEEEEEEVNDDNITEAVDENIPSQPLITDTEVQEILNNEEAENNSAIAVEVSEEVTDMQATVIAAPESSPTTTIQQGSIELLSQQHNHHWQTNMFSKLEFAMDTLQGESGMGDMLEIMKMDMMSQMQQ